MVFGCGLFNLSPVGSHVGSPCFQEEEHQNEYDSRLMGDASVPANHDDNDACTSSIPSPQFEDDDSTSSSLSSYSLPGDDEMDDDSIELYSYNFDLPGETVGLMGPMSHR